MYMHKDCKIEKKKFKILIKISNFNTYLYIKDTFIFYIIQRKIQKNENKKLT
jgi:hypothetical protein